MDPHDLERSIEAFEAAYARSVEAGEEQATRAGLRGRSDDWLRRLPAPVANAVRRAAGEWGRQFEEGTRRLRVGATVPVVADGRGRLSPVDFVYRTIGR
jgi:hypothetical protein